MPDSTENNARKMQLINDLMHATIMRERERCAKIAEDYAKSNVDDLNAWVHAREITKLIRGET